MTDWAASGRRDSYELRAVDPFTLQETGETFGALYGESELAFDKYGDDLATGTVVTSGDEIGAAVRVYHTAVAADGSSATEVLGTFLAETSSASAARGAVSRSHALYSMLRRHNGDLFVRDFSRPAGTNVVGEMRDIVEADGGHLRALPGLDSSREHTVDVWFEVGSGKGDALAQIARWCGWELGVDPYGNVTVGPYTAPRDRAPAFTFEDGANCAFKPGYDFTSTGPDAVNRVIARFSRSSKVDDPDKEGYDEFPLADAAVADLPARNPFSYERIGRHRTKVLSVGDACSHGDLAAQAQRELDENSGAHCEFRIEHAGVPGLRVGDVVRYVNRRDGTRPLDLVLEVAEMKMRLGAGCMCSTTLREVG